MIVIGVPLSATIRIVVFASLAGDMVDNRLPISVSTDSSIQSYADAASGVFDRLSPGKTPAVAIAAWVAGDTSDSGGTWYCPWGGLKHTYAKNGSLTVLIQVVASLRTTVASYVVVSCGLGGVPMCVTVAPVGRART